MSNKRITIENLNSYSFIKIPKELIFNLEKYSKLSPEAILIYGLLFDRLELSAKNGWVNDKGEIYIKFKKDVIAKLVRVKSKATITNIFRELKNARLIEEIQVGLNMANEIYLLQTEFSYTQITDEEILNLDENNADARHINGSSKIELPKNIPKASKINGSSKNELQEVQKMNTIKTNIIKTNNLEEEETPDGVCITKEIVNKYEECISERMSDKEKTIISELENNMGKELILKAIDIAVLKNGKNLGYIKTVLEDWRNKGLKTVENVDLYLAKWRTKNQKAKENKEKQVERRAADKDYNSKRPLTNFADYEQREYDYDDLEKQLLAASDKEAERLREES